MEWLEHRLRRTQYRLILEARSRAGMSRAALGAASGVSESVVAAIEDGSLLIDAPSRDRLLYLYGFWPEWRQGIVRDRLRLKALDVLHSR